MRAIVLSGGGSKGAYQMGVWAALKKLGIKYEIITGTSVGALNAAIMTQNTFYRGLHLWNNLNFKMIFDEEINDDYSTKEGKKNILKVYAKGILNGGMNVQKLNETVCNIIDYKKFKKSKINMGMITFNMKTLKPKIVLKKDMTEKNICDYLVASSSCFPAFQMKKIDDQNYIDGGIYDNLPINLAIDLNADEIIAVDLEEIGVKQKIKNKNIPITYIKPRNDIGSFLVFEKKMSRRLIKLGYNDTLKVMKKLDGDKFTFKKNDLEKNFNKYKDSYMETLKKILYSGQNKDLLDSILKLTAIKKVFSIDINEIKKVHIEVIESLGQIFELCDSDIYNIYKYNKKLIEQFLKTEIELEVDELINKNRVKDLLKSKSIIKYIYNLLETNNQKKLFGVILLFPHRFLETVYLKTIIEK